MIKKFLPSGDISKNISILVVGTFMAQLIPVLLQSVLRRVYPAEVFGVYEVFISITGMLMVIAALRYEMAVVLPDKRGDAVNLVFTGLFASLLFNTLLFFTINLFRENILSFLNLEPQYGYMLNYLPFAIFFFSSYQVFNYFLVRHKSYTAVSVNKISRRVSEGALQVGLGLGGRFGTGLIWGNIIGHATTFITGWFQMLRAGFSLRLFSLKRQWQLAIRYREFPLVNLIPALLNSICMHLPLILVMKFFDLETTAHFGLARQVLVLPSSIITLSISQVLLQTISEKSRANQNIFSDLKRIVVLLFIPAVAMTVLIFLWAPPLFALYAGSEYFISGIYAQIIVPGAALKLMVVPVSSVFIALKKIKLFSIWQAGYFLMISSLFFMENLQIETFLKVYLTIDMVAYGVMLLLIFYITSNYENKRKNLG